MARFMTVLVTLVMLTRAEMRERMERMVMVRTSGSDLQPEATGYIYKKEGKGPGNVIHMNERDVIKRLESMPSSFKPQYKDSTHSKIFHSSDANGYSLPADFELIDGSDTSIESMAKLTEISAHQGDLNNYEGGVGNFPIGDFSKYFHGNSEYGAARPPGDRQHEEATAPRNDRRSNYADGTSHTTEHRPTHASEIYGDGHQSTYGEAASTSYGVKQEHTSSDAGAYGKEHYEIYNPQSNDKNLIQYDANVYPEQRSSPNTYQADDQGDRIAHAKDEKANNYYGVYEKDFHKDSEFYEDPYKGGKLHKHADYHNSGFGSSVSGFDKRGSNGYSHGGFGNSDFQDRGADENRQVEIGKQTGESFYYEDGKQAADAAAEFAGRQYGFEMQH